MDLRWLIGLRTWVGVFPAVLTCHTSSRTTVAIPIIMELKMSLPYNSMIGCNGCGNCLDDGCCQRVLLVDVLA
jgi:hypothetical protein